MQRNNSSYAFSRSRVDSRSPPSPAASSPSLTQSASNSSSSPPQPTTPPRQPRPRYPDLGRVPLHRRGTSQTYERLEDLLREAGYKETRIFTPESDKPGGHGRDEGEDEDVDQTSGTYKKQGVGAAVVGFLTGLVTGANTNVTWTGAGGPKQQDLGSHSDDSNPDCCPQSSRAHSPVSPLVNKQRRRDRDRDDGGSRTSSEPQTPLMTSSIESLDPTPKAYLRQNSYSYYIATHHSRPPSRPTTPSAFNQHQHQHQHQTISQQHPQYQHQPSTAPLQSQHQTPHSFVHNTTATVPARQGTIPSGGKTNDVVDNVIIRPRPSRAGTYLRHMASTPLIPSEHPPRPNSTPARQHGHRNSRVDDSSSDIDGRPITAKPPLPRNWLDNVARAILSGVAATGVTTTSSSNAPPHFVSQNNTHYPQRTLRATRSSLSQTTIARNHKTDGRRSGLSDQTNTISAAPPLEPLALPVLFTRLERGRASCSQSVLKAQVLCRSAPASRASSAVRGSSAGGDRGVSKRQPSRKYLEEGDGKIRSEDKTRGRQHSTAAHSKAKVKQDKYKPKDKKNKKSRKADAGKPRVPSLARTRIEGDGWHSLRSRVTTTRINRTQHFLSDTEHTTTTTRFFSPPPPNHHRHPKPKSGFSSGYTSATNSYSLDSSTSESYLSSYSSFDSSDSNSSDGDDDDDDDEGELTLARMLVPPKRQHSIRSLRKHLHLHLTTSPPPLYSTSSTSASDATTVTPNDKLHPSLSPRLLHNSSSTTTLRSRTADTAASGRDGAGATGRVASLSVAQSRLLGLANIGPEKDLTPPPRPTATATRRAGVGGAGVGEWEHEWRKGKYSSRKSSEDDDEVESLTWLSRDDVTIIPNTATATGSRRSAKGKSRLGLPWNSPATATASLAQ